jgi:predicted AlkP superfamily pyrophosphatase or phosphodiesterase
VSHFSDLDEAQHAFGPGSPEAFKALEKLDLLVASILNTIDAQGMADQTYFALVSDHGFLPVQQQLRPNARFKAEGLLTTNAQGRVTEWQAYFYSAGGTGFVYLKNPQDQVLRDRVRSILERLAGDPANGIERLWSAADLAGIGADPQAAFGITMRRGFWTGPAHDTLLTSSTLKGMHGADPADPLLRSSLILRGPGIEKGGKLGIVRLTQIAPTLAQLLGVGLSPQADVPIPVVARGAQAK